MSIYKPAKRPHYQFDFKFRGVRFSGSTGKTSRREAEAVEREQKAKAEHAIKERETAENAPLTLGPAANRYWVEVGQYHSGAETTLTNLNRLCDYFGKARQLDQITNDDVAKLLSWRRTQTVKGRRKGPTIATATVNRSTIQPLQKLFSRARNVWLVNLPNEPKWRMHILKEPAERVREVKPFEELILENSVRPDYLPLINFARASGLRLSECLLLKEEVDLAGGRIRTIGKGNKPIDHPIAAEMRAILMAEMANPTKFVFTYVAARAKREDGNLLHDKGERLPITAAGLKTVWRRSRKSGSELGLPKDLRFHDLRHDFATKLLRETGNLKLVQKALHHSKVETTTKYAHVLDEEVLAGMEAASAKRKSNRDP